jgi:hypothetical protein
MSKIGNYEPTEWIIPPGPGEGGVEPVKLDDSLKKDVTAAVNEYGFNMVASERNWLFFCNCSSNFLRTISNVLEN